MYTCVSSCTNAVFDIIIEFAGDSQAETANRVDPAALNVTELQSLLQQEKQKTAALMGKHILSCHTSGGPEVLAFRCVQYSDLPSMKMLLPSP